jgi:hypothetical protein
VISTAVTGTNAADFAVTNACDSKALAAAATCTINVTFTPSLTAAESATLSIADTLGDTRIVALTGTGVAGVPGAQLSPTTLTFASQTVNTQSAGQDVTVTNNGTIALTGIAVSFTGANAGDFSETDTCVGAAVSIAIGANCKVTVKFQPTAAGARVATLSVTATGLAAPQTVAITGTAAAGVSLAPTTLAFGDQVVSPTPSAAKSVKLTNGATALTIASIAVSGPNAADFKETDTCAKAPTQVAPTTSCDISVTFTPGAGGPRSATLTVTDDQGAQTVALTGNGYTLALAAATGGSTSATVTAGQTATYNLQFSVTGASAPVTVNVACTGAPAKATCNAPASVNVTPGTAAAYTVTVNTTAATAAMTAPRSEPNFTPPANFPLGTLTIVALLFCIATFTAAAKNPAYRGRAIRATVTACLLIMPVVAGLAFTGCGGGSSGGTGGGGGGQTGTPAGTYTISITPTVNGTAQTATSLTLTVQ